MGIFSRRTEDDEPEIEDEISVRSMQAATPPPPPPQTLPPAPPAMKATPRFGVDEAIALLRTLPVDQNAELVMQVVRTTLQSMNVEVPDILEDAGRKQKTLEEKVSALEGAIKSFEQEISDRRVEITRLQADLAETTAVKQKLQLADAAVSAAAPTSTGARPSTLPRNALRSPTLGTSGSIGMSSTATTGIQPPASAMGTSATPKK